MKNMNFDYDFTEVCSYGSNEQYVSIVSDNGLALTSGLFKINGRLANRRLTSLVKEDSVKQETIFWTNGGQFTHLCITRFNELNHSQTDTSYLAL